MAKFEMVDKDPISTAVCDLFGTVCGACATKLVNDMIEQVIPNEIAIPTRIAYSVGSYAIGFVIGDTVAEHMGNQMKETAEVVLDLKHLVNESKSN